MLDTPTAAPPTVTLAIRRQIEISILDNGIILVGSTACASADQFHTSLRAQMDHPFATAPVAKRTRQAKAKGEGIPASPKKAGK